VKDATVEMAGHYIRAVAPTVNPVEFERRVVIEPEPAEGQPRIRIAGTKDLVDLQPAAPGFPDGVRVLRDLKTKTKSPAADEADRSGQLSLYALLDLAEHGKYPDALVLDHVVRTPVRGDLRVVTQVTQRDDRDTDALLAKIQTATALAQAGNFMPNTDGWKCSPKWCQWFSTCRYVSDRRK
jgi:hypothetical protein